MLVTENSTCTFIEAPISAETRLERAKARAAQASEAEKQAKSELKAALKSRNSLPSPARAAKILVEAEAELDRLLNSPKILAAKAQVQAAREAQQAANSAQIMADAELAKARHAHQIALNAVESAEFDLSAAKVALAQHTAVERHRASVRL